MVKKQDKSKDDSITVDEAIEHLGFGSLQWKILIVCGIIQATDAMEMLILAILGPILMCEWHLQSYQIALLTTVVFIGMMIGAPTFGFISDRYGRHPTLVISCCMVGYFGCLSALCTTYTWLLIIRGCVGFSVGGLMSAISALFSEFMTTANRARGIVTLLMFWTVGGLIECLLAYFVIPVLGWRWWLVISAIPLLVATFLFLWIPESPRYLVLAGEEEAARAVLNKIAEVNKKPLITEKLISQRHVSDMGNAFLIFHPQYRLTSILLFLIWFTCGFVYYGITLVSTYLPQTVYHCLQNPNQLSENWDMASDISCCNPLKASTYLSITIATLGEFIGIPFCFLLLELIGRRGTFFASSLIAAVLFFCLDFCMAKPVQDTLLFLCRGLCMSLFDTAYVYSTEVFPTAIRTVSMGMFSSVSRIGAIITPFVAQMFLPSYSTLGALLIYSIMCILASIASLMLPIETRGMHLKQTVENGENTELKNVNNQEYATFRKSE